MELALYWAPVFYHDTDATNPSADQFTRFNFDGDWVGTNNWSNEPDYVHPGQVYYSIHETADHHYISYMVFHPRDWSECEACAGHNEHENDMEGAILAIRANSNRSSPWRTTCSSRTRTPRPLRQRG